MTGKYRQQDNIDSLHKGADPEGLVDRFVTHESRQDRGRNGGEKTDAVVVQTRVRDNLGLRLRDFFTLMKTVGSTKMCGKFQSFRNCAYPLLTRNGS